MSVATSVPMIFPVGTISQTSLRIMPMPTFVAAVADAYGEDAAGARLIDEDVDLADHVADVEARDPCDRCRPASAPASRC